MVNMTYAQSLENFFKHSFKFACFSGGGNLGFISMQATIRIHVVTPALIRVTVAKPNVGFASRLLIMIGFTAEPSDAPAVMIDVASACFLSK